MLADRRHGDVLLALYDCARSGGGRNRRDSPAGLQAIVSITCRRIWNGIGPVDGLLRPAIVPLQRLWSVRSNWHSFISISSFLNSLSFSALFYGLPVAVVLASRSWTRRTDVACESPTADDRCSTLWIRWYVALSVSLGVIAAAVGLSIATTPVAHYRYIIAVTGLWPILLGIAIAGVSGRTLRTTIGAGLMAGLAWMLVVHSSDLQHGTLQRPLRYERWSELSRRVNSFQDETTRGYPILVYSNLIEEDRLANRLDSDQLDYFRVPLVVFNRVDPEHEVIPCATRPGQQFTERDLQAIERASGAWLAIRAGPSVFGTPPPLVQDICSELVRSFRRRGRTTAWIIEPIPQSTVYLCRFVVSSRSGSNTQTPNGGKVNTSENRCP